MADNHYIDLLLHDESLAAFIRSREDCYWQTSLNAAGSADYDSKTLSKITYILACYAIDNPDDRKVAETAYRLLHSYPVCDGQAVSEFDDLCGLDLQDKKLFFFFILSSIALLSDKTISARLVLSDYVETAEAEADWIKRLETGIMRALLYLIRKKDGYEDVKAAINQINQLQKEQSQFEKSYLDTFNPSIQTAAALDLVALYHTSKALVEAANYLLRGYDYQNKRIDVVIRQHIDLATKLAGGNTKISSFISRVNADLKCLVSNSIWSKTAFQNKIKELCKRKADMGILELLPSQKMAFDQNLFDIAANAIILEMPTSAGKTLLAEFNIIVSLSMLPDAKVLYVAPSRALVNQVYHDLSEDLEVLGFSIAKTSSVNEIDPAENTFISSEDVNVLVSTPEKLDLLIRRRHPSVENISLVIVDEAHMMSNGIRGARLELLISMLRREKHGAKFMLLSPFLPGNPDSLKEWLGGGNMIKVDWKPSEKVIIGISKHKNAMDMVTIPSLFLSDNLQATNTKIPINFDFISSGAKKNILEFACRHFAESGKTILVLCQGRGYANKTAQEIGKWTPELDSIPSDVLLVKKYIEEEIGCDTIYSSLLTKGIAIHHAGLSDEIKILVEHLIRTRQIKYVCATTTVAEGVNFPVSTVYFDSYYRGSSTKLQLLSSNDFWNVCGRAGRTMVDEFGRVILPFNSKNNKDLGLSILQKGTEDLVSVLAKLFADRDAVEALLEQEDWQRSVSERYPDSFGPLFQYFVHLLNVSKDEYVDGIEELFKDTYEYTNLSVVDKDAFIDLCNKIYRKIESKYSKYSGALNFADKTGFSVPSVLKIMHEQAGNNELSALDSWEPEALFNYQDPSNLTEKIRVIGALKETKLGTEYKVAPFNPRIVAKVLIAWVKGEKLNDISQLHPGFRNISDTDARVSDFVKYLTSTSFKSSWGLSALEGIVRGDENELEDSYVPSFVYYGVDNKKALALRMIGVPRILADSMSDILDDDMSGYSYSSIKNIIKNMPDEDWTSHRPDGSSLSGEDWKKLVGILIKER